jgi:hypothetical protein
MLVGLRSEKASERKLETIQYLNELMRELAGMAKAERLEMPAYLLEMAYVELSDRLRDEHAKRQCSIPLRPTRRVSSV